ncbi:P-loop NTPase [Nocardioides sp. JQ2195]|uniref:AAA family ATPase n=1 Tax=Nocardioides sp. JQ2195 TaxID=2592334 RepID=UPI00143EEDA1|nr:P-loop NTPase [Nocardioides sp. JQ2195]QIX27816.1 P-loop NTPase [Nocardioides sp. JQ2195]
MTTLVEQDPELIRQVREVLGADVTVVESLDRLGEHLATHPHEYAVVVGQSVDAGAAGAFAEASRIQQPALGVIMLRSFVDTEVLANALRSGMRDVIAVDDLTGLSSAVARSRTLSHAMSGTADRAVEAADGLLFTIFSTKGGVGKSLVATNVAAALADQGRRVCIVDLDVQCGDVAIMLQLNPLHTLADLTQLSGQIDPGGVESLLSLHSENLSVLAAPVQLETHVQPEQVSSVLETLKTMFDVVVVDTSGAFDDHALAALDHSDLLVLVGTLDIPALKSLKLAAGTLDLLNYPRERWRLVLNRADSKVGLSAKEFEETLGVTAAISIPSSRDVLAAVNRGETIVRSSAGHQISKTLTGFAGGLYADAAPASAEVTSGGSRRGNRRKLRAKKVS